MNKLQQAWQVLERTMIHDGMPWVRLSSEHVRLPNGVEIPDFYRVEITPYVSIFAVTQAQEVIMVEHYKHGPQMLSLELPAGYIETDDDPLASAQRELREETGFVSDQWQSLGRYFIDGNRGCGWMHAFIARDCYPVGEPQPEETELITLHRKTLDEIHQLWYAGEIPNVTAMSLVGRALYAIGYLDKTNG